MRLYFKSILLATPIVLASCAAQPAPAPVQLPPCASAPKVDYSSLAKVLAKVVTDDGLVDSDALRVHRRSLDAQLALLTVTGPAASPEMFRSADEKLAYWYNARAAWSLKLLDDANCPKEISPRQYELRPFTLDGRQMTLAGIDELLAADADWRVLACAPDGLLSRARLRQEPFLATGIFAGLKERLDEFLADGDRFVIDEDEQTIFFPPVIWRFRAALIRQYQDTYNAPGATLETALLPYVSGQALRRLHNAVGFREAEQTWSRRTAVKQ